MAKVCPPGQIEFLTGWRFFRSAAIAAAGCGSGAFARWGFLLKNPANSKLILSAGNGDVLQFEDFATFAF